MSKYITAYTGGATISGFTNIGNIAVDTNPGSGNYALGNFVGGVLDSYDTSGYVVISDNTTAGVVGWSTGNNTGTASANTPIFWVSPTKDDVGFLYLINRLPARYGQSLFTNGSDAKTWLDTNGYWTSYVTGVTFDPDAQLFITNATITDTTQQTAVNTLVIALKAYGIWTKIKAIYPFVGGTAETHKFNLKNPLDTNESFRLTFSGGWIHSSTGAKPNGTNGYAETYFNISSGFTNANKGSAGGYWRTTTTNNGYFFGINSPVSSVNSRFWIRPLSGTGIDHYAGGTTILRESSVTDFSGFRAMSRISSNDMFAIKKDGSFITLTTNVTTPFSNETLILAAAKVVGVISGYSSSEIAFGYMSDDITQSEMTDLRTAVNDFQTNLGRNV
jgi:hypothetical protein